MTAAATSGSSFGFPDSFNSLTLAPCDAICAVNSASDILYADLWSRLLGVRGRRWNENRGYSRHCFLRFFACLLRGVVGVAGVRLDRVRDVQASAFWRKENLFWIKEDFCETKFEM